MKNQRATKGIAVLSSVDTRQWHSPFSKILREMNQAKIVDECIKRARVAGFERYEIYDAYETKLAAGIVPGGKVS